MRPTRTSPKVKICGVTSVEDAELCVELGADYLGLNFYPPSPRYLELSEARRIARSVEGRCGVVAVVADASAERVAAVVDEIGPDLVQFHGDERAGEIERWAEMALKALRIRTVDEAAAGMAAFGSVWGFLLDARHDALLGGTGRSWDWDGVERLPSQRPVLLAGGIGPGNVRSAGRVDGVYGVDVCSAVESRPGRKSRRRLERLFEELRGARPAS